jgi:hypothetical protein
MTKRYLNDKPNIHQTMTPKVKKKKKKEKLRVWLSGSSGKTPA